MKKRRFRIVLPFSIHKTILFSTIGLVLLSIWIYFTISLNVTRDSVLNNSTMYTRQLIEQLNQSIDSYINYMEDISRMILANRDVANYLEIEYDNYEEKQLLYTSITDQFHTLLNMRDDICNIAVCSEGGRVVLNDGFDEVNPYADIVDAEWYKRAILAKGEVVVSSSHVQNIVKGEYRWVVTVSRAIKNSSGDVIGALMVDLNYNTINNLCEKINLGNSGYIYILDEFGNVVYHPKQDLIYNGIREETIVPVIENEDGFLTQREEGGEKIYVISTSDKTGWKAVGVANATELISNRYKMVKIYVLSAAGLCIVAACLSYIIACGITRPIKLLKNAMKRVENGQFDQLEIPINDRTEVGRLGRAYNLMVVKIQNLMEKQIEDEKSKRKSELRALQAQIKPHFLYNTLDSIIWMAEGNKNEEVVIMTSALSKLFRQSISNEAEKVRIRLEIEYIRNYLTIQKMRYKDQLNYLIDVDLSIGDCYIPKLILQPLVENAIYHGIKYKQGLGMIRISGQAFEEKIILKIQDDGIGMSEEELSQIFDEHLMSDRERKGNGFGVKNVRNRLSLYYGSEYGLIYESEKEVGTVVKVIIPIDKGEGEI